jgi:hypothetical protein
MEPLDMLSADHSILEYKISDNDLKSYNPYLKKLEKIINEISSLEPDDQAFRLLAHRNDFVSEYSFTIPYHDILAKIASYSPIVEIGAGSGYWARCLTEMGADVLAFDSHPPGTMSPWEWHKSNAWYDDSWYGIIKGDESEAAHYPDRTLFMAWPMPMNLMAYNALAGYKNAGGKTVIYIGDPHPASSGDEHFYRMLYEHKEIETSDLYSWPGIREKLLIYSLV